MRLRRWEATAFAEHDGARLLHGSLHFTRRAARRATARRERDRRLYGMRGFRWLVVYRGDK